MAAGDYPIGTIESETQGDVTRVSLLGCWDLSNVGTLQLQLRDAVGTGRGLVVSLARTEFLDASIINVLFGMHEQMRVYGRQLVLEVNTASIVRRVLDVSGLAATLPCSSSTEDAIAIAARTQEGSDWATP
jgi:anti-anti-sigma factor